MDNDPDTDQPTRRALYRMADVLRGITAEMQSVSDLVSGLTTQSRTALDSKQVSQLQAIDRVVQSLQDLTVISKSLATEHDRNAKETLHLQLAETRFILSPDDAPATRAEAGAPDLF